MTKLNAWYYIAAAAALGLSPSTAMAGTRAGDHKIFYPTAQAAAKVSDRRGPEGGFPNTRGLEIAKVKADDHAAFKPRASNGC